MLIAIDPHDPRSLYVQIIDEIRRAIVLGHLRPDDALPSVRQLAVELRINPNTTNAIVNTIAKRCKATEWGLKTLRQRSRHRRGTSASTPIPAMPGMITRPNGLYSTARAK